MPGMRSADGSAPSGSSSRALPTTRAPGGSSGWPAAASPADRSLDSASVTEPARVPRADVGMAPDQPVDERPIGRLERDPIPRNRRRLEEPYLERLRAGGRLATHDAGLERDDDHRGLEPRVDPDELAW